MAEHHVYRFAITKPFLHYGLAVLIRPATWHTLVVDVGMLPHLLSKALMPLCRRRDFFRSFNLKNNRSACLDSSHTVAAELGSIASHLSASVHIVATYVSRVVVKRCLAVKEYNGYLFFFGPLKTFVEGIIIVWRHDEKINARVDHTVYLLTLPGVVVVGIDNCNLHIGVV